MKFKTDENLPVEAAEDLRQAGHDALTVADQKLAGQPDVRLAEIYGPPGSPQRPLPAR
jgi:hypothetical protein